MQFPFLKAAGALAVGDAPMQPARLLGDRASLEAAVMALSGGGDPRPVFVVAFGLERFDRLRASIGYGAVDDVLEQLGKRLHRLENEWRISRVSHDVVSAAFCAEGERDALLRVDQVRRVLQSGYSIGPHVIDIRLAAGLSAAGPPAALVRAADLALDVARTQRTPISVFDPRAQADAADALSLMSELREALRVGQLHLEHQLKIDLRTGDARSVESLIRWNHPEHGRIAPDRFIPLSEETGCIGELTTWVLERAFAEQDALAKKGFHLPFAVNLSGRLLGDEAFVAGVIDRQADRQGVLRLEITETAVIDDPDQAVLNVRRLARAGIPCSIDDYGAGLSCLTYLKRLEADELKLDRSLVTEVARSKRDALVTRSTVDLAHSLGMTVVAEGVEDRETAAVLASMGCDLAQGFYFHRPARLGQLMTRLYTAQIKPSGIQTKPPQIDKTAVIALTTNSRSG